MAKNEDEVQHLNDNDEIHIRAEARGLSEQYSMDYNRVLAILLGITKKNIEPNGQPYIYRELDFEESIKFTSPDDALTLFEKDDLDVFTRRYKIAQKLTDKYSTVYNLSDWQKAITAFIIHQSKNIDSLSKTGYPKTWFQVSPWFNWRLNRLYWVKDRISSGTKFKWERKSHANLTDNTILGSYEDGDCVPFLSDNDECMLDCESFRTRILCLRNKVMTELVDHLKSNKRKHRNMDVGFSLMDRCFAWYRNEFNHTEIKSLLDIDQKYVTSTFKPRLPSPYFQYSNSGGLLDLSELIHLFCQEVSLRFYSEIRDIFCGVEAKDVRVGIDYPISQFYYTEVNGDTTTLNRLIDFHHKLEPMRNELLDHLNGILHNATESIEVKDNKPAERPNAIVFNHQSTINVPDNINISIEDSNTFTHSIDYRSVRLSDKLFELTPKQAEIISILHKAFIEGFPSVPQDRIILEVFGERYKENRLIKAFQDTITFRFLIAKGKRRDTFRLNV